MYRQIYRVQFLVLQNVLVLDPVTTYMETWERASQLQKQVSHMALGLGAMAFPKYGEKHKK